MAIIVVHGAKNAAVGQSLGAIGAGLYEGTKARKEEEHAKELERLRAEQLNVLKSADKREQEEQEYKKRQRALADIAGKALSEFGESQVEGLGRESAAMGAEGAQQGFASGMQKTGNPLLAGVQGGIAAAQSMPIPPDELAKAQDIGKRLAAENPQAAAKFYEDLSNLYKGRIADREERLALRQMQDQLAMAADGPMGQYMAPVAQGVSTLLQAARRAPPAQRAQIIGHAMAAWQRGVQAAQKQFQFDQAKLRAREFVTQVQTEVMATTMPGDPRQAKVEEWASAVEAGVIPLKDAYKTGFMLRHDLVETPGQGLRPRVEVEEERRQKFEQDKAEFELEKKRFEETQRHNKAMEAGRGGSGRSVRDSDVISLAKSLWEQAGAPPDVPYRQFMDEARSMLGGQGPMQQSPLFVKPPLGQANIDSAIDRMLGIGQQPSLGAQQLMQPQQQPMQTNKAGQPIGPPSAAGQQFAQQVQAGQPVDLGVMQGAWDKAPAQPAPQTAAPTAPAGAASKPQAAASYPPMKATGLNQPSKPGATGPKAFEDLSDEELATRVGQSGFTAETDIKRELDRLKGERDQAKAASTKKKADQAAKEAEKAQKKADKPKRDAESVLQRIESVTRYQYDSNKELSERRDLVKRRLAELEAKDAAVAREFKKLAIEKGYLDG